MMTGFILWCNKKDRGNFRYFTPPALDWKLYSKNDMSVFQQKKYLMGFGALWWNRGAHWIFPYFHGAAASRCLRHGDVVFQDISSILRILDSNSGSSSFVSMTPSP